MPRPSPTLSAWIRLPLRHEVGERAGVRWCSGNRGRSFGFYPKIYFDDHSPLEKGRAIGNAALTAGAWRNFIKLLDMTASFEPRIRNPRDRGFQQLLRLGQRIVQPRTFIQFVLIQLLLLHQLLRSFAAFIAQQIDLKRQQPRAPQRQRNFLFLRFHQNTMTGLPLRGSFAAENRAPFGLFLTNRSNRSTARISDPVANTIGTASARADSHFTVRFLFVFTPSILLISLPLS
jgi:hypothetical protein